MSDETLDLGHVAEDMAAAARKRPCSGECGKMWDDAGGGWIVFGEMPHWYCDPCDKRLRPPLPHVELPDP